MAKLEEREQEADVHDMGDPKGIEGSGTFSTWKEQLLIRANCAMKSAMRSYQQTEYIQINRIVKGIT